MGALVLKARTLELDVSLFSAITLACFEASEGSSKLLSMFSQLSMALLLVMKRSPDFDEGSLFCLRSQRVGFEDLMGPSRSIMLSKSAIELILFICFCTLVFLLEM